MQSQLAEAHPTEEFLAIMQSDNTTEREPWPDLAPIPTDQKKAENFPLDALGPIMGEAAKVIARDVQAPDALAAGAVLAAAALASQAHFNVCIDGRHYPLSLFLLTACSSGDRKSEVDRVALKPINDFVNLQLRAFIVGDQQLADANQKPLVCPALVVSQGTTQALSKLLEQQAHLGIFSSEGAEVLGGHSLKSETKESGFTWFLKAWSGERLETRTKGDGAAIIANRRISMHLLIQPIILQRVLADPLINGNGFLARILIAQPESLAGSRFYSGANPLESQAVKRFHKRLEGLLSQKACTFENSPFELNQLLLKCSPEAYRLWVELYNEIERKQATGMELEIARGFASKAPEQMARIAGVITAMSDQAEITIEAMAGAGQIVEFYLHEHLRLTRNANSNSRNVQLLTLFNWLLESGPKSKDAILKYCPRSIRGLKKAGLYPLVDELLERNYLREFHGQLEASTRCLMLSIVRRKSLRSSSGYWLFRLLWLFLRQKIAK